MSVREAQSNDWRALRELDERLIADGRGEVRSAGDLQAEDVFRAALDGQIADPDVTVLVAIEGSTPVGRGTIRRLGPSLLRHVAFFDIGIDPLHQGRGHGRRLAVRLVESARAMGVERLQLYVRADNTRAHGLYRTLGFAPECTRVGFVRLPDGTLVDDEIWVCWLEHPVLALESEGR